MIYWKKEVNQPIVELTPNYIEYFFNSFVPNNSLIVFPDVPFDKSEITDNISTIIFDDCTNPINVSEHLQKINLDNFKILSGLFPYYENVPYPNVYFFPFWAVWISWQQYKFSNLEKHYLISCLNGTPNVHRKLLYLELNKKSYFKDMIFTFKNNPNYIPTPNEIVLTNLEHEEISKLPPMVTFLPSDLDIGIDLSISHPAYQESYINLVTETTVSNVVPMLSEKTFKPIVAGQLFVLVASPGSIEFLRKIGIDTFDDIIDHSYDQELDVRQRILKVVTELDRLTMLDIPKIYNNLSERLKKNSTYLNSEDFRNQFHLSF